jgi:hypothetical protein
MTSLPQAKWALCRFLVAKSLGIITETHTDRLVRPDDNKVTLSYDALGRRLWKKYGMRAPADSLTPSRGSQRAVGEHRGSP